MLYDHDIKIPDAKYHCAGIVEVPSITSARMQLATTSKLCIRDKPKFANFIDYNGWQHIKLAEGNTNSAIALLEGYPELLASETMYFVLLQNKNIPAHLKFKKIVEKEYRFSITEIY